MNIQLFEINPAYINYLSSFAPHLFFNKKPNQQNERKYIGVVLQVNGFSYFAPLSSFKPKHRNMKERMDFIKLDKYAVINLNNMFPIPNKSNNLYSRVNIAKEANPKYKSLLLAEYRIIRTRQDLIKKNAAELYKHKIANGNATALAKRCNDFQFLEKACLDYLK